MAIKIILFMSVAIAWQVVPLECELLTYPNGTPATVTQYAITQSSTYVTVSVNPALPSTTTAAIPNPVPTSITTTTPYISTIFTTTTATSQNTSTEIWQLIYSGYLLLNSTVPSPPPRINEADLEEWLKIRTNRSQEFEILKFNQITGNGSRKKRSADQTSRVIYELGTNASNFYEEFKKTENFSSASTIRNNKVEQALLWLKGQLFSCPAPLRCENGRCQIGENVTFPCASPSGGEDWNRNLLALLTIPCVIVLVLVVILIVFLVRRSRKEKQKQYITKIHPAAFSKTDEYAVDSVTKRSLEGFNSVKSSNFEYENETLETGLY